MIFVAGGGSGEQASRSLGLLAMSFAGMIIAVPMYIEARALQADYRAKTLQKGKARGAQKCATCGMETGAFWCTTHLLRLCADCVTTHDEPTRCLYRSMITRAQKAGKGK
jgi:hypothetical protein